MSETRHSKAPRAVGEDRAALVTRYYAAIGAADEGALRGLLDPGFVLRSGGGRMGLDAYIAMLAEYRMGFHVLTVTVRHILADGLWIAVRTETSGLHTGTFLGHDATFRSFSGAGADFLRVEGGHIIEIESHFDTIGMLAQLGLYEAGRR